MIRRVPNFNIDVCTVKMSGHESLRTHLRVLEEEPNLGEKLSYLVSTNEGH